jgi:hypothetical protein
MRGLGGAFTSWHRPNHEKDAYDLSETGGFNISVCPQGGGWSGRILGRKTQRLVESRRTYATADAAKLGAFDGMIFLEGKGWGRRALTG